MPPEGGVLFVHAHPDDESVSTGGVIARLVDEGTPVHLVTCTDGAEGEIHDPDLDVEEARPRLAAIRARELACSLKALGDGAIAHHLLGYRDSGMMGTEANTHPDSFWQVDLTDATRRLVQIVADSRPLAIVSYDPNGNYGHPDHINAHRIAMSAYEAVEGVDRFYEIAFNRERWSGLMTEMQTRGIDLPWDIGDADPASDDAAGSPADDAPDDFGTPEALITTRVDVSEYLDRKRRSMMCHRTQRQDMGWLLDLPDDLAVTALATEFFVLRRRRSAPIASGYREDHLV